MADDDQLLPAHFSSFDDAPLPASFSSFDQDTMRRPEDAVVGTGVSGAPALPASWADVANQAAAATHGVGATYAGFAAGMSGDPATEAGWRKTVQQQQAAEEASRAEITPGVQPGWGHPLMAAAEAAPGIAAIAAPAAAANLIVPGSGIAVMSGLMGAQTQGDVYNRLTEEGVEPTFQQKAGAFALGAATGAAMDLTGGLAAKVEVSPLVRNALGITGSTTTLGVGTGAQEYTSQADEIAAGVRQNFDPNAIVSQTLSGAETGAEFGIPHLLTRGAWAKKASDASEKPAEDAPLKDEPAKQPDTSTGRNLQAKPGETGATQGRTPPAKKQGETKARATTAAPSDQAATGVPPASPIVDPAQQAAADAAQGKAVTGEPVPGMEATLGVNQPTEPVIQPPPVAQPTGETAQEPQGGPPAGQEAAGPSPPPPAPEPQPAPAPAPPDPALVAQQHAQLVDPAHPRDAMIVPKGIEPPVITTEKGKYGRVKLPGDQGTAVYNHDYGRGQWSKDSIKAAAKDGTLDDKIEAQANKPPEPPETVAGAQEAAGGAGQQPPPAAAEAAPPERGEQPEAVQTEPVEPKVAEPTPRVEAPADEKLGENKFGVSVWRKGDGTYVKRYADGRPEEGITQTVADLLTKQGAWKPAEKSEAETIREAAEAEAARMRPERGRVLPSLTEEEQEAAARQREADAAAAAKVAGEQPTPPPKEKEDIQERNLGDEKRQKLLDINDVAREVANAPEHLPKADETMAAASEGKEVPGARKRILERAQAMVEAARDKGYKFMRPLRDRVGETNHPNEGVLLHEAELLARKKVLKTADVRRFMYAENELRNNGEAGRKAVMDMRSQTGREWAAAGAAPTVETAHEGAEGGEARGIDEGGKPDVAEEMEAAKERVAEEEVAKEPGEKREETALQRQAREASERARAKLEAREKTTPLGVEGKVRPAEGEGRAEAPAPRAAAGFTVEKRRTIIKKQEMEEGHPGRMMIADEDGNPQDVVVRRTSTASEAIDEHYDPKQYAHRSRRTANRITKGATRIMEKLRDLIVKLAGDTPVHYITVAEMQGITG